MTRRRLHAREQSTRCLGMYTVFLVGLQTIKGPFSRQISTSRFLSMRGLLVPIGCSGIWKPSLPSVTLAIWTRRTWQTCPRCSGDAKPWRALMCRISIQRKWRIWMECSMNARLWRRSMWRTSTRVRWLTWTVCSLAVLRWLASTFLISIQRRWQICPRCSIIADS